MTDAPRLSVVVPTFDGREHVLRLLRALDRQTLPRGQFEVVVVVDGSEDGTKEALEAFDARYRLRSIFQQNRGRSAARNAGIHAATGDLIVFVDDDIEPAPTFLAVLAAAHRSGKRMAAVGAVHCRADEHTPPFALYWGERFDDFTARLVARSTPLDWSEMYSGALGVLRSDVLAVGGFEETFDGYGLEDFELALRLRDRGLAFELFPDAVAYHYYDKDFATAAREAESRGRSAVIFAALHPDEHVDFAPKDVSPPSVARRLVRYVLPRMSAVFPFLPGLVIGGVTLAERVSPRPLSFSYTLGLEYFYLLGKQQARRDGRLTAKERLP